MFVNRKKKKNWEKERLVLCTSLLPEVGKSFRDLFKLNLTCHISFTSVFTYRRVFCERLLSDLCLKLHMCEICFTTALILVD